MADILNGVFDCSLVLSFKKKFFGGDLPPNIEDRIIEHLLTCAVCEKVYVLYGREIGIKNFNVQRYALRFYKNNSSENTKHVKEWLMNYKNNKLMEIAQGRWTRAAKDFDINELMNIKAFRDLSMEYNSPTKADYSGFYQYLALKIAQKIDHLELCFFKEYIEKQQKQKVKAANNNNKSRSKTKNEKS